MKKTLIIGLLVVFVLISGCTSTTTVRPSEPTPGATSTAIATLTPTPTATSTHSPTATPTATPAEKQIEISNFNFVPNIVEVSIGTTVTWTNNDNVTHTITSVSGSFDSGSIDPGNKYSIKFDQAGTYEYSCTIYAGIPHGKVIVRS